MTEISFNFKTIVIQLIFIIGLVITLHSGVVLILLLMFSSVAPIELPTFTWVPGLNQLYSILTFIGIIFLGLGAILFVLLKKKEEQILKEIDLNPKQIEWFLKVLKTIILIGGLLILFAISDIISVLLYANLFTFNLGEIGDHIQRFTGVYFFLLIGISLSIVGILLFRKNGKLYAEKTEVELIKLCKSRIQYFYGNSIFIGILFIFLFGSSIPILIDLLNSFLSFYPWNLRYLSNLKFIIFNTFFGILLTIYGLLCLLMRKRNLEKSPKIVKTSKQVEKRNIIVGIIMMGIGIIFYIFSGFASLFFLPQAIAFPEGVLGFGDYHLLPLYVLFELLTILLIVNGVLLLTTTKEYMIDFQNKRNSSAKD